MNHQLTLDENSAMYPPLNNQNYPQQEQHFVYPSSLRHYNRDVNGSRMTQSNVGMEYGAMGPLDRLSPSSSISSCQDATQIDNFAGSTLTGKLKKRSTSTNSGLKSLGRIFGGSSKKAKDLRFVFFLFFV